MVDGQGTNVFEMASKATGIKRPRSPTQPQGSFPSLHCAISSSTTPPTPPHALSPDDLVRRTRLWKATCARHPLTLQERDMNIVNLLKIRECHGLVQKPHSSQYQRNAPFDSWAERVTIAHGRRETFNIGYTARSTIALAFSHDGLYFASTHGGDHSVKIFSAETRRLLCSLHGHARTPWTVKFHPCDSSKVASGCLGFQVRIWDIHARRTVRSARLEREIVSLAFHPSGRFLAMACGHGVFLWDYENPHGAPVLFLKRRKNVRCVSFTPCGTKLITGEACADNSPSSVHRINGRIENTVQVLLWRMPSAESLDTWFETNSGAALFETEEPILIVPHAILYNDGGLGISTCGRHLCLVSYESDPSEEESGQASIPVTPPLRPVSGSGVLSSISLSGSQGDEGFTPRLASIARRVNSIDLRAPTPPPDTSCDGESASLMTQQAGAVSRNSQGLRSNSWGSVGDIFNTNSHSARGDNLPDIREHPSGGSPPKMPKTSEQAEELGVVRTSRRLERADRVEGEHRHSLRRQLRAQRHRIRSMETPHPTSWDNGQGQSQASSAAQSHSEAQFPLLGTYKLIQVSLQDGSIGAQERDVVLVGNLARGVTSVKFSATNESVIIGYGLRHNTRPYSARLHHDAMTLQGNRIVVVFRAKGADTFEKVKVIESQEDDLNIALFHPIPGYGFVFGTKQGCLRSFGFGTCDSTVNIS